VTFFPVDSTRTDLTFLKDLCRATLDAGADELAVVDTLGACSPEAVELLISEVRAWFGPKLPLHFHGHNDFGLATACAIAAVRAGATWIQEARSTAWESGQAMQTLQRSPWPRVPLQRPGRARPQPNPPSFESRTRSGKIRTRTLEAAGGRKLVRPRERRLASQFHMPEAIEPYSADLVGAERKIVLGKKSGLDSITLKAQELGLEVPEAKRATVLNPVKVKGAATGRLVTDSEFRQIVMETTR